MTKSHAITIPYDVYESSKELVLLIPVGWVNKESISLEITNFTLNITAMREKPTLKDNLVPTVESCYRWEISLSIALPPNIYFDKIHSKISKNNVLSVIIPKNVIPEHIPIQLES